MILGVLLGVALIYPVQSTPRVVALQPRGSTSWATECITEADNASVYARCAEWLGLTGDFNASWGRKCVASYCELINPPADCGEDCPAIAMPTTREKCKGSTCKHYRLSWNIGASLASSVPKLVKLTGTKQPNGTKWIILPYIGFYLRPQELQEVDMWIDDLGTITNGTVYLDTEGEYSAHREFASRFIPNLIRIAPVDDNVVTDIGYKWQFVGPEYCDQPGRCRHVAPLTVTTSWKYYDLLNPEPVCISRGLCPWKDDHGGYARTIPSWREREEMVKVNALRSDALKFFDVQGPGMEGGKAFLDECGVGSEAPPYYFSVSGSEGARLKAWEYAVGRCGGHDTCFLTTEELHLANNEFTTREEAHTFQPCIHPFACPTESSPLTNRTYKYVVAGGASHVTGSGAAESIGEVPFFGSCADIRGLMNPEREMASVGYYPMVSQDSFNGLEAYSPGVFVYFHKAFADQPWNNKLLNTYHPIPSGSHFIQSLRNGSVVVRFMAQFYDYNGIAPKTMEVVIDGIGHAMNFSIGYPWQGTYEVDVDYNGTEDMQCLSYFFRSSNCDGMFTLPQSGAYVYRTSGVGVCREEWLASACDPCCRCCSTCGFPGVPCVATFNPDVDNCSSIEVPTSCEGGDTSATGTSTMMESKSGDNSVYSVLVIVLTLQFLSTALG